MTTDNLPYIAPFEVALHNTPNDCWVSLLGKVINVTPLIKRYKNDACIKPILAFAGKDVSNWFDPKTGDIQHYIHPITGVEVPYCPHGRLPDVPPASELPSTLWTPLIQPPWWKDKELFVGNLTKRVRPIKIINMLCAKETLINVCCEDTFDRIKERYAIFNSNGDSYTWTFLGEILNMKKTMEENGIPDERDIFVKYGLHQTYYIPSVFLFYNDDMRDVEDSSDED